MIRAGSVSDEWDSLPTLPARLELVRAIRNPLSMIITIDGYAGSGKSSAAQRLADALGFQLLNTGGMYRAAAIALGKHGIDIFADPPNLTSIAQIVETFVFDMPPGRVILNEHDYTEAIRSEDAGKGASRVATFPAVRARLKQEQRRIADGRDMVCEGRDQGTAVFPDAPVKFFFVASAEVRADRRVAQLRHANLPADRATILKQIQDRDRQDETRSIDPLKAAPDALPLDTTALSLDAVLARMIETVEAVKACRPKA